MASAGQTINEELHKAGGTNHPLKNSMISVGPTICSRTPWHRRDQPSLEELHENGGTNHPFFS